jgi:hypothetical protein
LRGNGYEKLIKKKPNGSSLGVVSVPLRGNGYEKPHEVETVVIFSFQGAVAPDYAKR